MTERRQDLDATNRDFSAYDQVDKQQDYRLAEAAGEEAFDDDFEIRTVDLRGDFAAELGAALTDIGFAVLEGHGVDPRLFEAAERELYRVFDRPLEDKLAFRARRHGAVNQGYFPIEQTADIHPDLVEGWVFCRRAFGADDPAAFWPDPASERVFTELCQAERHLVLPIMRAILGFLGCEPGLYDERLVRANFGLRLNYYPPVDGVSRAGRLLGHEDTTLFTLLPAPRTEGLQVLNRRNFKWIRLDAPPGTIILNTGDYMQRITNDRLPSTTHRVSQPRDAGLRAAARVSFPMNVYLPEDEMLEVLPGLGPAKYEPIKAITFHTRTTAKYYGDDYAVGD